MMRTIVNNAELLMAFFLAALAEKGKKVEDYITENTPTADKVLLWVFADIISDDEHSELSSSDWVQKYYKGMPAMSVEWILSWFDGAYVNAFEQYDDVKGYFRTEEPNIDEIEKQNNIARGRIWHTLRLIKNDEFELIVEDNS